ncbi:MAG: hypothetical protein WA191_07180 [Telluria sp.]
MNTKNEAVHLPAAPAPTEQPKLVIALPDYETRRIVIVSDEAIDDERVVCVAIEDAAEPVPTDLSPYKNADAGLYGAEYQGQLAPAPLSAAPVPTVQAGELPYGYVAPFRVEVDKHEIVTICDASGCGLPFELNTHTQRSLDDTEGLAQELKGSVAFADFMAKAMNSAAIAMHRAAAEPVPAAPEGDIRNAVYMALHFYMKTANPNEWEATDAAIAAMMKYTSPAAATQPATVSGAPASVPQDRAELIATHIGRLEYIRKYGDEDLLEAVRTGQTPIHRAIEKIDAAPAAPTDAGVRDKLDRIERVSACGTVDSFMSLPDADKRFWFAMSADESERRKLAEERLAFLHSANKDAEGFEYGVARVRWDAAGKVEFYWALSDHSDIDAARLSSPQAPKQEGVTNEQS